jgi:hypothetical protein
MGNRRKGFAYGLAAVAIAAAAWALIDRAMGGGGHRPEGVAALASASRCPRHTIARPAPVDEVLEAARRIVVRGKTISSQGHTYRLTAKNTPIIAAVRLAPFAAGPEIPGALALRRLAVKKCGHVVAERSWAVVIEFPLAQIARTNRALTFLTLTRDGWRAYWPAHS